MLSYFIENYPKRLDLIQKTADVLNVDAKLVRYDNRFIINQISSNGNLHVVEFFFEKYKLTRSDICSRDYLILKTIGTYGHVPILQYFIKNFQISTKDLEKSQIFENCLKTCNYHMIQYLLQNLRFNTSLIYSLVRTLKKRRRSRNKEIMISYLLKCLN